MTTREQRIEAVFADAGMRLASTELELRSALAGVIERCESALRVLDQGFHCNELGVIQSAGFNVDRLCALREERAQEVRRLAFIIDSKESDHA